MLTRFIRGNTEANNRLVLKEGMISINTDDYSLRIHDGVTPGGFEVKATQAVYPPPTGPGPQEITKGDKDLGYYGTVSYSTKLLPTADELYLATGMSQGTNMAVFLTYYKVSHKGKTLFIPAQTLRYGVSWNKLNELGLVRGETIITYGEHQYRVRLPRGANVDPVVSESKPIADPPADLVGDSEWEIIRRFYTDYRPTSGRWNTSAVPTSSNGRHTLCMETYDHRHPTYPLTGVVVRGNTGTDGLKYLSYVMPSSTDAANGWRPILEYIPPEA